MGWVKKLVRAGTPAVCAVATTAWVHAAAAELPEAPARAVSLACVALTTGALFAVAFVHGVLRGARHDTWCVAAVQAGSAAAAAWLTGALAPHLPAHRALPAAAAELLGVLFLAAEARALCRALCALSDALDALAARLDTAPSAHADTWVALLRHATLAACLAAAAGAVLLLARTLAHAGTALAFAAGGTAILCVLLVAAVLVLPRASLPVACATALVAAVQLAAVADIARDAAADAAAAAAGAAAAGADGAGAGTLYAETGTPGVWRGALHALWDRVRGRGAGDGAAPAMPLWLVLRTRTLVAPHACVVAAGVLALVAVVVAGVERLPGEERDGDEALVAALAENDDDDGGCGAARRRLGAGWRAARATLLAAWPCLVALLCVPPCHPAWVLAQTAGIALGHLCRATGYEIHVFPHED